MTGVPIRLTDVALGYGGKRSAPVVAGVTCSAPVGTITVLIGPNAAGKSTVLRGIGGHLAPQRGTIDVLGAAPHRVSGAALAARVAMVAQRGVVAAPFLVEEVVRFGRYALPADQERIDSAIDAVDMLPHAGRIFAELSAGQQQRVLLARAIAQVEPGGILLLDEPTSAMDLPSTGRTLRLLRTLAAQGITVVMVLHDLIQAQRVADRVWLLGGGSLRAEGEAAALLTPEMLESLFGVPFVRLESPGERPLVLPEAGDAANG